MDDDYIAFPILSKKGFGQIRISTCGSCFYWECFTTGHRAGFCMCPENAFQDHAAKVHHPVVVRNMTCAKHTPREEG